MSSSMNDPTFGRRQEADLTSMSDARIKAEIRRLEEPRPAATAEMDGQGNVALRLELSPEDRQLARQVALQEAKASAERIGSPGGLAGLFPTNRLRWRPDRGRAVTLKNGRQVG